jgi:hypothetical protein
MIIKKKSNKTKWQWLIKKWILVNIIRRYFLNIFKIHKQSYSITKQKIKSEQDNIIKRKVKTNWSSITSKSNIGWTAKKKIKKTQFELACQIYDTVMRLG